MLGLDVPPRHIGPYRILEVLGEGGMGVVYLAQQEEPVRRKVALKILKLGMDMVEVIGRFEAERQALAMMNHPSIAKVFDARTTEQGRPYFVMEHIPGEPITDYCDRHRLVTRQRLGLFIPVCEAIHHAHQNAIIHRDIKPSHVLVMLQDGKPVPKVIDFGVAKAVEHRLTERTIFTEQGQLIGTPEYMSPEQAEMTGLHIDTRTDVYGLGVLLYELLSVRYYGLYANRSRAKWRGRWQGAGSWRGSGEGSVSPAPDGEAPRPGSRRGSWARLLRRILEVDPLECPRCRVRMQVISVITEPRVVDRILAHVKRGDRDPFGERGPPGEGAAWMS